MLLTTKYSRTREGAGWGKRHYTWPRALGAAGSQAVPGAPGGRGRERPSSPGGGRSSQRPSNGVLFGSPLRGPVSARARRSQGQEAFGFQAAEVSPRSVQEPRPGPLGPPSPHAYSSPYRSLGDPMNAQRVLVLCWNTGQAPEHWCSNPVTSQLRDLRRQANLLCLGFLSRREYPMGLSSGS